MRASHPAQARLFAAILALVLVFASITSGVGVRCYMHCQDCTDATGLAFASSGCNQLAPAAPSSAPRLIEDAMVVAVPAGVVGLVVPAVLMLAVPDRQQYHGTSSPPGGLVLRI